MTEDLEQEQKPIEIKVNKEHKLEIKEKKEVNPIIKESTFKPSDILSILTIVLALIGIFIGGVSYGHIEMCEANGGEGVIGNMLAPWSHECEFTTEEGWNVQNINITDSP